MRDERRVLSEVHPCCLTIAGSDSGGNAGVQADLRTFHAYKLHGCTVFTALTAQNPNGVYAINEIAADFVGAQLDAVLGTYSIAALKTGMLGSAAVVEAVVDRLKAFPAIFKVVDPVMVATSGAELATAATRKAMEERLLPLATLITPNIPETEALSGKTVESLEDIRDAAKCLYDKFGAAVLIKGGHQMRNTGEAEDILFDGKEYSSFSLPRIENPISTHGTGCTLSAAIASELALGRSLKEAVKGAKKYVYQSIEKSYLVGENCGVLF
jgi:hydroxymethylpyrimidine kinase/phosphomethylpyrimidine kinase